MSLRNKLVAFVVIGCLLGGIQAQSRIIRGLDAAPSAPDEGGVQPVKKTSAAKTYPKRKITTPKTVKKAVKLPFTKTKSLEDAQKYIEYNQYDKALSIISKEMNNPYAKALYVVWLAKQYKLNPAQSEFDKLVKLYPKNSDLYYAQGIIYMKRSTSSDFRYADNKETLYGKALGEFQKSITLDEKNYRAMNAQGVAQLKLLRVDDAKKSFDSALKIAPDYATAIDNLGTLDLLNSDYKSAQAKFEKALAINSKNPTAMYHMAQVLAQKGELSNALGYLNNALAIDKNSSAAYNLMGEIYDKQGNAAAAINCFKKSISIKPENTTPYLNLSSMYEKRADGEFAIEPLKTALSIDPELLEAKLKIADISLGGGKYNQAIEYYTKLIGENGYNSAALKGVASAYFEIAKTTNNLSTSKDYYNAYECVNKAIAINPNDLELYLAKLKLAKILNRPKDTTAVLNHIIHTPTAGLSEIVTKGEAYLALNDYDNADKTFVIAMGSTRSIDEDIYLAEIFTYYSQFERAKLVLDKILVLEPKNEAALNNLAYIEKCQNQAGRYFESAKFFNKEKNTSSAIEYLNRSLALNPNNPSGYLLLGKILEHKKDYKGALGAYRAYVGFCPDKKIERKISKLNSKVSKLQKKMIKSADKKNNV